MLWEIFLVEQLIQHLKVENSESLEEGEVGIAKRQKKLEQRVFFDNSLSFLLF
jgi:hypothetical protein